ncbi:hypothetical protein J6590_082751 [Homalodisca vitripennis]|nr:hypothetical protein J6590_082751 [Homalodisca vitripennis]
MDRTSVKMCQGYFLSYLKLWVVCIVKNSVVQEESRGICGLPHRCLFSYLKNINDVQIAHVMKNKVIMPAGVRRNLSSDSYKDEDGTRTAYITLTKEMCKGNELIGDYPRPCVESGQPQTLITDNGILPKCT